MPLTLTLYGLGDAFEVNAQQPESLPVPLGVYVNVRVVLPPAATEKLLVLDIVNSLLVPLQRATPVTFSVAVPGFEIVTVTSRCEPEPATTFPKATGFGVAEICGAEAVPVPLTSMLYVGFALSSEATAKQPVSAPAAVGVNVNVRVVLEPADTVKLPELETVNSLLVFAQRVIPLTLSVRTPVLLIVTVTS